MSVVRKSVRVSEEEFFAYEARIEGRAEYYDGVIVDMAGGSYEHSVIAGNFIQEIGPKAREKGCRTSTGDIKIVADHSYLHPDVAVVCGPPEVSDLRKNAVRNPTLLVEILSESTADRDRGIKWKHYQTLESLREYVMIEQHIPQVFVLNKSALGEWVLRTYIGLDAEIQLNSLDIRIQMSGIYDGVAFPDAK